MKHHANLHAPEGRALVAETLGRGLRLRVQVTGKSMAPFLKGGRVVTLKRVPSDALRCGDIVLFATDEGRLLLHRLVRIHRSSGGRTMVQTQGDALCVADAPVDAERVLGRVVQIERSDANGETVTLDLQKGFWPVVNRLMAWGCCIRVLISRSSPSAVKMFRKGR